MSSQEKWENFVFFFRSIESALNDLWSAKSLLFYYAGEISFVKEISRNFCKYQKKNRKKVYSILSIDTLDISKFKQNFLIGHSTTESFCVMQHDLCSFLEIVRFASLLTAKMAFEKFWKIVSFFSKIFTLLCNIVVVVGYFNSIIIVKSTVKCNFYLL